MSDTIIRVENLGKKYLIKHQQQGSYTALRDVITDKVKSFGKKIISPWNHKQSSTYSTTEEFWALKDISFKVKQGEVIGIIGRNGAGKSTLLKILSRITEPTTGRFHVKGRVASLLEVGTGFHPELTGRENIFLNGSILGMTRQEIKSKFDEIVAFSEIEKFLDTPVKRYSSGMYVRLAFAVAAHLESEILLVDEVLAVGDMAFQKKCLGKMDDIGKEGRTVLFVSHNMLTIKQLCTKGFLLEEAQVSIQDDIGPVVNKYLSEVSLNESEKQWISPDEAPGDDKVRIKTVRISVNGETSKNVKFTDNVAIEIEYWILSEVKFFFYLRIDTPMGIFVLLSANTPSIALHPDPWFEKNYSPGTYRTVCNIPPWLLNNGQYDVSVFCCSDSLDNNYKRASLRNIISFLVDDLGETRKEYQGPWETVIRPRLVWQTIPLEK